MASLGTGIAAPGQTVITVGTSGAVRKVVDQPWFDSGERTWCYILSDRPERPLWIIGGAINNGGLTLQWAREKLYPDLEGAAGYEQLAAMRPRSRRARKACSCCPTSPASAAPIGRPRTRP